VESVQVKGIREEVRVFEIVLDGSNKAEMINIETEHLRCSMDINRLEIKEIDQLAKFIEDARQQVQGNGKKVE
jgi:hypothetical protein